jgi:plasmid stabilization system protein ParE
MNVRVLPEAFEDLWEAIDWYNERRDGLGDEFEDLFYSSVQSVQRNPLIHGTVYRTFRRHLFKRFLYSVYYRIHKKEIIVSLIFHLARNPKTLRRILRSREKLN